MCEMASVDQFRVVERHPGLLFVPAVIGLGPFVDAATERMLSKEECAERGCVWNGNVLRDGWYTREGVQTRSSGSDDGLDLYLYNMLQHVGTFASMNGWHGGPLLKYPSVQTNVSVDSYDSRVPANGARVVQGAPSKVRGLMACMASTDWRGWEVLEPVTGLWEPLDAGRDEMVVVLGALGQWAQGIAAPMLRVMYEREAGKRRTVTMHWDKPLCTPDCDFVLDRTETAPGWASSVNDYMRKCREGRVVYDPDRGQEPLLF